VEKSVYTYKTLIEILDEAGNDQEAMRVYQDAFREGLFNPWVGDSRYSL
jgi:hypothetical protein